jgi:hypothetical protein
MLRIPDNITSEEVSCPRCLARLPNPQRAPRPSEEDSNIPSASGAGRRSCPRCGKPVETFWRFCPFCEAVLKGREFKFGGRFDDEVRRNRRGTSIIITLLAVLGGIGVAFWFLISFGTIQQQGGPAVFIGLILGLLFLGLASTVIMFYRTREDPSQRGVGRVLVGTLALTGGLIAFSCLAGMAFFVFAFVTCLLGNQRW